MPSLATDDLMPAYASLQVEVYLAADAGLDSRTAGQTAQFVCPDWTSQRHLDYGMAQHAIAMGLQPGADQDACTAAAFMHCAAGGQVLAPNVVPALNKALKPKPLGAAFSHARKVAAKTGGGKAKERAVAQRYLSRKGHARMGKAVDDGDVSKAMHPRALRPIRSRRPTQIGTTRSGKKIYDVYAHPAHASFNAADHRDMIAAAAASMQKPKTPKT